MKRLRLARTPRLDKWLGRLDRRLKGPDERYELVSFIEAIHPRGIHYWQTRLNEILAKKVIPNGEIVLVIDEWMNGKSNGARR